MYRVLSLDGGGVRGILTLAMLERIQEARPDFIEKVDLIAGTSIGGIMSLALAKGMLPTAVKQFFYDNMHKVFDTSWIHNLVDLDGLSGSKFDNSGLVSLLSDVLGTMTLGDLAKKVVIPTFNLDNGSQDPLARSWGSVFMHNFDGKGSCKTLPATTAGLRTSAAPTYFPTAGSFIDGGVIANDPSMAAVSVLRDDGVRIDSRPALDEIVVLSLGTGAALQFVGGTDHDWGAPHWVEPLIQLLLDGNVGTLEYYCRAVLEDHYFRVQPVFAPGVKIDLSDCSRRDELIKIGQQADLSGALAWIGKYWDLA
jgi:patatin-like phospholipase/acyl hydrolase